MLSAAHLPQVRAEACISLQASWEWSKVWTVHIRRTKSSIKKWIIVCWTVRSMFGEQTFAQLRTGLRVRTYQTDKALHSTLMVPYTLTRIKVRHLATLVCFCFTLLTSWQLKQRNKTSVISGKMTKKQFNKQNQRNKQQNNYSNYSR